MRDIFEIVLLTQSGITVEDYSADVQQWLSTAKHPRWNRSYTELVYQPILEVLSLLQANGFTNFIATGGGGSFVREYSSKVYNIRPECVCRHIRLRQGRQACPDPGAQGRTQQSRIRKD